MKFLSDMLSGMSGEPSTMRVLTAFIVVVVMGAWGVVSVQKGELQPLSYEQIGVVLGALGLKAWQRGKEGEPPSTTTSSTTTSTTKTNP